MTERDFIFWLDGYMEDLFNPLIENELSADSIALKALLTRIYNQLQITKRKIP